MLVIKQAWQWLRPLFAFWGSGMLAVIILAILGSLIVPLGIDTSPLWVRGVFLLLTTPVLIGKVQHWFWSE